MVLKSIKEIKTVVARITPLQKGLAALGMVATIGVGIVAEDRFVVDVKLHSGNYTGYEYRQLREQIGQEASLLKDEEVYDINKFFDYVAILNIEAQKCKALYSVQTKADVRGMVKKFDTQGCPERSVIVR